MQRNLLSHTSLNLHYGHVEAGGLTDAYWQTRKTHRVILKKNKGALHSPLMPKGPSATAELPPQICPLFLTLLYHNQMVESIQSMAGAGRAILLPAGAVLLPLVEQGQQKAASTRKAGEYRSVYPQNVELPTVPIINLSMQTVADMNGGILPQAGNVLREDAVSRARERLGLNERSAAYIPASNVTRNGEEYILKITKASLNKMLSPTGGKRVPIESIAVLDNLERIANNGVWFDGQGDRKNRTQINGIDHLKTIVYIDGTPYEVDMRVRLVQENANSPQENVLYYYTPEEIVTVKKVSTNPPTVERRALNGESEDVPTSSDPTIPQPVQEVNPEYAQVGENDTTPAGAVLLPLVEQGQQKAASTGGRGNQG